ncbi:TRAP transporter small permease [Jiella sp. M17.18]|uniref:TRAP transporter small permease n=1 Tax=Jiella sp. M17.18 TaxID=3234247 RepID=UPI0034E02EFE
MLSVLVRIEEAIGRALLAAIVILVFVAAITRFFDYPIVWSVDLAQALFIWLCFFGALKGLRKRAHIGVDYFVQKLPVPLRRGLDLLLAVIALAFLATMAWFGIKLTLLNWQRTFGDSGISYAWVTIAVPIGCALLGLILLAQIAIAIRAGKLVFSPDRDEALAEHQEI